MIMRHTRIIAAAVVILLIMAIPAAGQIPIEKIGKGFKGGFTHTTVTDYAGEAKSRSGFTIGGFMNVRQSSMLEFQLELLYINKGYKIFDAEVYDEQGEFIGYGDFDVILNYLSMPLIIKLSPPGKGSYRPYLAVGGYGAANVSSRYQFSEGIPFTFDRNDAASFDFGPIFGIGIDAKAGKGSYISFEFRYEISLAEAIEDEDQKLRTFSFTAGYWF
jgi:hypothetical protein